MAEKNADDNPYPFENGSKSDAAQALPSEETLTGSQSDSKIKKPEPFFPEPDSYVPLHESSLRKEENPFSFKKFLNQDSSAQKNKGARKKVYIPESGATSNNMDSVSHSLNRSHVDLNSRMVNATAVSSVLPDFVQDHLVIEQCYLRGGSDIKIDNLNLETLSDLNLGHKNAHFSLDSDRNASHSNQSSPHNLSTNLPDFTFGARNLELDPSTNIRLPDFSSNERSDGSVNLKDRMSRRKNEPSNEYDTSHSYGQRAQISSSPSVPLDLPSYEINESNKNLSIPFDLTVPAEENNSNSRGISSTETVSKSLPDFLSDGPIKKNYDDNLQNIIDNENLKQNGLPLPEISSIRSDPERLIREIKFLRQQLFQKNRRLEALETELEHLQNKDQAEAASIEYAIQEVENNLKQTAKRAVDAEQLVLKLKQENKMLKSEICCLRSENVELRQGNYDLPSTSSHEFKNKKVANDLRSAANKAEHLLRSLLIGVDNLRILAASMENSPKFSDSFQDYTHFSQEDSASGPAL